MTSSGETRVGALKDGEVGMVVEVDGDPPRLGSDGQGLEALRGDPVVKANAPSGGYKRHGFDTAHLTRYDGTDFVQWVGRRRDGYFCPWGKLMCLTEQGKAALAGGKQ